MIEEVLICDPVSPGRNEFTAVYLRHGSYIVFCRRNPMKVRWYCTVATGPSGATTGLDVVTCSRHGSVAVVGKIDGGARVKEGSSNHRFGTWLP